jgi:hypothetical protein
LIWDPRELPFRGEWFADGPLLPIEFARQSRDGRVTLVLLDQAPVVRSLWTLMSLAELHPAKEALADREGMTGADKTKNVGCWSGDQKSLGLAVQEIADWAGRTGIEAVIWTALPATFGDEYSPGLDDDVLDYLRPLSHEKRRNAERYIRKAPKQIDTEIRRRIEREFGWLPID